MDEVINMPLVSILMAVYYPNYKWLKEQLISLNNQSYPNLELIIYDDCPENPLDEEVVKKSINKFSYRIIRGKENLGSNKAFEELTRQGEGQYFAYCDQDDVWEEDKISLMMEKFKDADVTLVCSDLCIIDENGKKTHDSIRDIRKRIVYKSGYRLAKDLLMTNFITGCAMMIKNDIATKAIPFNDNLVHDQWLGIIAALNGKIEFIDKALVRYRQHQNNQTGILKEVCDKKSYYNKRIQKILDRYYSYKDRLVDFPQLRYTIDEIIFWLEARKGYGNRISFKDLKVIIRYIRYDRASSVIEIILPFIPDFIFKWIIRLVQRGLL